MHDLCHKRQKYARLQSSALGYVYMSAGADIKLMELVGEHTILCDYKDADCTVQENINPLKTKSRPFYLKTQSVPRSKHSSSRL